MSFAITAVVASAAVGYYVANKQKTPEIPAPAAPAAPPEQQAAKMPSASSSVGAMGGTGQAGGAPGVAQTFLTGAGGVDPNKLMLGKSTLLGM